MYLYTLPGRSLPARPALWTAEAFDIGTVINESAPNLELNHFSLTNPQSITINTRH